jgi:hypothetical protein
MTVRVDFPYLIADRDRHGVVRHYVRRHGRKIRLRERPGTQGFAQAYADAMQSLDQGSNPDRTIIKGAPAGTLGWLAACYFASTEFRQLDPKSQATRRGVIEDCLREPRKRGISDLMRDCPVNMLAAAHIKMLRDRKDAMPGAANNRRKYLSSMFGWAVENGLMRLNPARDVRKLRYASDGYHTWTVDEVRQYESRYLIGTKARLALALLLYLGVRRGDVVNAWAAARQRWLAAHGAEQDALQAEDHIRKTDLASARRHHRAQPDWRSHISDDRVRQTIHRGGLWWLVS